MHHLTNFTPNKAQILADESATLACGQRFAKHLQAGLVIYLLGDLGAGKTTFTRGMLQGIGYQGKVKSPTYTLLEQYEKNINNNFKYNLYHYDLYRFNSEEEWEMAGFRDYFNPQSVCVVEWPEKAQTVLPMADIVVKLSIENTGRTITFFANTTLGNACLTNF